MPKKESEATEKPPVQALEKANVIKDRIAHKQVVGFVDFVREQGIVGLAIGLIVGVAAKGLVDSIVNNIFNPIIGVLTGGVDLGDKFICIKQSGEMCASKIAYGQVVSDLISFIIVAILIYLMFKMLKLDRLDKKK